MDVRAGHVCPSCKQGVHVFCGEEDPNAKNLHTNVTCYLCVEKERSKTSPRSIPPGSQQKKPPKRRKKATGGVLVPKKVQLSNKAKSLRLSAEKTEQDVFLNSSVCFCVDDEEGYGKTLLDYFGGTEKLEDSLEEIASKKYLFGNVVRRAKLPKKGNANVIAYDVHWEDISLPFAVIDLQVIISARELSTKMRRQQKRGQKRKGSPGNKMRNLMYHPDNVLGDAIAEALFHVHEDENGEPLHSDSSEDEEEEDDLGAVLRQRFSDRLRVGDMKEEDGPSDPMDVDHHHADKVDDKRFKWRAGQHLRSPIGLSKRGDSKVKAEKVNCFNSPIQSPLSFVPIKIFKLMVHYSNLYAHQEMNANTTTKISGAAWTNGITLQEMMVFFGILFEMVLRPTPGQSYTACWKDGGWHPYSSYMPLRRFQQLRSVLHFSDNSRMNVSNDSLFKVRPLLNCLKHTFPAYLDVGDELALDEASIACRSKYGGFSIFYNPMKPGGKYHFRFYMLCCSSSYACVRLRMHTRDMSDAADGFVPPSERKHEYTAARTTIAHHGSERTPKVTGEKDDDDELSIENDEAQETKLTALVLDMCSSLNESGRVVNMDNYYTSPEVAVALKEKQVFIRGTCRSNRNGFPTAIQYTKTEAARVERGTQKMVSDKQHGLVTYGWVDGNPVHFLTSADGTAEDKVQRKVGRSKRFVKAPVCIKRYNHGMQAVDRHDQLRQTFALADRHAFKKYYVKIALGLMDMAVVNAFIHYKLVHPEKCKKDSTRYDFMDVLAKSFLNTNWNEYGNTDTGRSNEIVLQSLVGDASSVGRNNRPTTNFATALPQSTDDGGETAACVPYSVMDFLGGPSKKAGLVCQVCKFDERGNRLRSVGVCAHHNLRLCTRSHKFKPSKKNDGTEVTDYTWRAPDNSMTCWQKAHAFYIPKGLFKQNPPTSPKKKPGSSNTKPVFQNVLTSSEPYTKKRTASGLPVAKRGWHQKTGNKRKRDTAAVEGEQDETPLPSIGEGEKDDSTVPSVGKDDEPDDTLPSAIGDEDDQDDTPIPSAIGERKQDCTAADRFFAQSQRREGEEWHDVIEEEFGLTALL